jgi:S1-C subfamily serine protease
MKTSSILLAVGLVLLPWCLTPLFSQQPNAGAEKKITIIKHSIDADGSEVTETIVKKGKAAENFDVDKYVRDNRSDKNQVEVIVTDIEEDSDNESWNDNNNNNYAWTTCNDKSTFLGVQEDSDEDENQPGLVVEITRGSAADKAGLRHNDNILQLNSTKTDQWEDLSQFVSQSKPGDKVKITYSRNGKTAVTEAVLTTRNEVKCDANQSPKGFLGITEDDEIEVADGIAVSITPGSGAAKAGLNDGDVIVTLNDTPISDFEDVTDFMAYTKPAEKVRVTFERQGQRKSVEVVLGEQKNSWSGLNAQNFNLNRLEDLKVNLPKMTCTVKEKEACLGVYSTENEPNGASVESFTSESAAQEAGMQEGDVILSVNEKAVNGHSELWDEIAQYKTGENVAVVYLRNGKTLQVQATLKACRDNQSRVEIFDETEGGSDLNRLFYTGAWGKDDQRHLRETRIIIIRRAGEGDGAKVNLSPSAAAPVQDRTLSLSSFRAFPNPSQGQVTVAFTGAPMETVVSLLDMSGRQLFREELNAFNGDYSQQFDLTAYAKGTIIIHVQQGDKVFTEQIIVQ